MLAHGVPACACVRVRRTLVSPSRLRTSLPPSLPLAAPSSRPRDCAPPAPRPPPPPAHTPRSPHTHTPHPSHAPTPARSLPAKSHSPAARAPYLGHVPTSPCPHSSCRLWILLPACMRVYLSDPWKVANRSWRIPCCIVHTCIRVYPSHVLIAESDAVIPRYLGGCAHIRVSSLRGCAHIRVLSLDLRLSLSESCPRRRRSTIRVARP